jgi:hypothetical protein
MATSDRQSFPLVLTSENLDPADSTNSTYIYRFPNTFNFKDARMALSKLSIYYSWQSITSALGNNTFSLVVPVGASTTTITLTLPDGSYSVSDINSYIQDQLIANGIGYLVDGDGNYVYYFQMQENSVFYAVQLNAFVCPDVLPSGYTNPGSWTLPTSAQTGQFVIPEAFGVTIGFTAGDYPSSAEITDYSVTSDLIPQLSPVSSVIILCDALYNTMAQPNTVLYSFSPDVTYGSIINVQPPNFMWCKVTDGYYSGFKIRFVDQSFMPVTILDTNITLMLLISLPL